MNTSGRELVPESGRSDGKKPLTPTFAKMTRSNKKHLMMMKGLYPVESESDKPIDLFMLYMIHTASN